MRLKKFINRLLRIEHSYGGDIEVSGRDFHRRTSSLIVESRVAFISIEKEGGDMPPKVILNLDPIEEPE